MGVFSRKKSKKKQQAQAASRAPVPAGSDSDISLMTDSDLEEERAALHAELNKPRLSASGLPAAADPFEQASLLPSRSHPPHPTHAQQVDRDELERIALNIARNALPASASGEGAEAAARLNATAAAAEKAEVHDSTDPLGYGRIDTRLLTLVRDGGPGARQPPRYSAATAAGLLDAARRGALAGRGRGAGAGGELAEAPPALRARVLPGGENFDAELYLGTIHRDTSLADLQRGLLALRQQLSEHTGQLKSLVKENFDRFTSSKNTIDTVYAKLQRAEAEGEAGVHGASTGEVLEAVLQVVVVVVVVQVVAAVQVQVQVVVVQVVAVVQGEARHAFGPLLERAAKAERIRLVLGVMRRYEAIVQLPSRVRQHAEAGDYEQVVADYRKAKALLGEPEGASSSPASAPPGAQQQPGGAAGGGGGSMWVKLMDEIDKVVSSVAHSLDTVVRSAASSPGEAADAARHILQLRAVGAPAAQRMDPVGLYVESQERHVRAMLEGAQQQRDARLVALRRQQQASADSEAQAASLAGLGVGSGGGASPAASAPASAAATPRPRSGEALAGAVEAAAVGYVARITAGMCQWLPEYWALTQHRLPALAAIGDAAAAVERGMAAAERSVAALLSLYRSAVLAVLSDPAAAGLTHTGLLSVAAELANGCQALQAPAAGGAAPAAAPPAALDCLQRLAERAILASLAHLSAHLAAAVAQLCAAEDFRLTPASRRAGAPATASLPALQRLVQHGMAHLAAALAEGGRAGADPLRQLAAPRR
ncbi:hypothetical protein CHLNCDRAFT_136162 [Chlorella variabilis]|uniref:Exocyst complex component SEC5 n=1 Tax=Chlorella variabilis TaxID=554065 RepID=E1ZJW7_CHLVA|nr:hypothetical protein CHLNCDRAFT_136162 [Chlorella variabilis]EFN53933.1 hypothetical protein CHLNCDRAFT_136162 [Chlorella variabilis]|eukprot:XP_005846035.1 hypothetical protein CHLNCDRAFT_136162 [Chlorella variabilis]